MLTVTSKVEEAVSSELGESEKLSVPFWLWGYLLLLALLVQGSFVCCWSWEFPVCTLTLTEGRGVRGSAKVCRARLRPLGVGQRRHCQSPTVPGGVLLETGRGYGAQAQAHGGKLQRSHARPVLVS